MIAFQIPIGLPEPEALAGRVIIPLDSRDVPPGLLYVGHLRDRTLPVASARFADQITTTFAARYDYNWQGAWDQQGQRKSRALFRPAAAGYLKLMRTIEKLDEEKDSRLVESASWLVSAKSAMSAKYPHACSGECPLSAQTDREADVTFRPNRRHLWSGEGCGSRGGWQYQWCDAGVSGRGVRRNKPLEAGLAVE
jgi:hypothetical protein